MANISTSLTQYLFGLLTSDTGVNAQLQELSNENGSPSSDEIHSIRIENCAVDLVEKTQQVHYPAVYIYCEKLTNSLREKFATFSGKARLVVEVRCSQDRLEGIEQRLELYVDAVCQVLDDARGSWQDGSFYAGGYEVTYGPVKQGGRNLIQVAKLTCDVDVSK